MPYDKPPPPEIANNAMSTACQSINQGSASMKSIDFNMKCKRREKYIPKPTNRSLLCLSIFKTGKFSSVLAIFLCPSNPNLHSHSLCVSRCQWDSCARRLMLHIHIRDITTHPSQTNRCIASGLLNSTPKNVPTSPYNTNKPITSGGNIRRLVADLSELRWRTSSPSSLYSSNDNLFSSNSLFSSLLKMLTPGFSIYSNLRYLRITIFRMVE